MNIELKKVRRYFGEQVALDIDAMTIAAGEVLGLTGENGSGKTTLLRIVAGLDRGYEGDVLFDKKRLSHPGRHDVCYVHQQAIALKRSVACNLMYPLVLRGVPRLDRLRLVEREIDRFGLAGVAGKRADRLSGGERQKMALARALLRNPSVLLLDEPIASIDAKAVDDVLERLLAYKQETNATFILVSHGVKDIAKLCTRLVRLEKGCLVAAS